MSGHDPAALPQRDVVFFDLDDTLYDQAAPFGYAVRKILGPIPGVTATDLFETSRRYSQEIFAAFRRDEHPTDAMYIRRMQLTLGHYGVKIDPDTALALQHAYGAESKDAMKLAPEIVETLDWCSSHTRLGCGIITNGKEPPQRSKMKILGLDRWIAPDEIFISDALGYAKPQPELFQIACDHFKAKPSDCLYIGDAFAIDVLGAHSVHMPVIWFNHRLRPAPPHQFPADQDVHTASELRDLVKAIVQR